VRQENFQGIGLSNPFGFLWSRQMTKKPPDTIAPRLLSIKETASYWGVSPNTFRKYVAQGIAPGPINVPGGRLLFGCDVWPGSRTDIAWGVTRQTRLARSFDLS
jgi:hypothetical protein